jgi:hypothetical protein
VFIYIDLLPSSLTINSLSLSHSKSESPLHFTYSLSRVTPVTPYSDWSDNKRVLLFIGWTMPNSQKLTLNFCGKEMPTT